MRSGWHEIRGRLAATLAVVALIAAGAGALLAGGGNGSTGSGPRPTASGGDPGPRSGSPGGDRLSEREGRRSLRTRRVGSGRGGVGAVPVGGRFDQPTYVTGAPGFPRLVFVVEQPGAIRVMRGRRVSPRPFLDIRDRVVSGGEQGLLSVAFPPDYRRSGRFYVYYTADPSGDLVIAEHRRRGPLVAEPGAGRTLLRIPHREHTNHNGGQLQFLGRQLFIGTGDGGGAGDPDGNAQDRSSLLGKLLRILPRGRPYTVPRGNPFTGRPGRPEIFSYGLRNPWRFSFDRLTARRPMIAIADVGQSAQEEVNYLPAARARGANFGWDLREGFLPYESERTAGLTDPVFAYGRDRGCSITGGHVVRDRRLRSLFGRYLFADFCEGELRSFAPRLRRVRSAPNLGVHVPSPSSFGEDRFGRVYVASLDGHVYRLVPTR